MVSGQFHLKEGTRLKIAVGQRGISRNSGNMEMTVGGAGGTFVTVDYSDDSELFEKELDLLLVAGKRTSCDLIFC